MVVKILAWLIYAANTDPWSKPLFYSIKNKVLEKYGTKKGFDQQHIKKECWSCDGSGIFHGFDNGGFYRSVPPKLCFQCSGSGVFDEFWVLLEVWELGKYEFHKPVERVRKCEYFNFKKSKPSIQKGIRNYIEGYIDHTPHPRAKTTFFLLTAIYCPKWFIKDIFNLLRNKLLRPWWKIKHIFRCFKYGDDEIPF